MANELRIEAQLEYSKNDVKHSKHDSTFIDVSGDAMHMGIQAIGTGAETLTFNSTDLSDVGYVFLKNLGTSGTIYIDEDSDLSSSTSMIALKPGEFAMFRSGVDAIYALASSAENLQMILIEA